MGRGVKQMDNLERITEALGALDEIIAVLDRRGLLARKRGRKPGTKGVRTRTPDVDAECPFDAPE